MVRLKDIASRAGVSTMTVSKVMRDEPDISEATKSKIRQLASEMGYMPDTMAQGLRSRSTKLFGLVLSTITNPIFAPTALAIEEESHNLGYSVILAHSMNNPEREEACLRRLLARRVDGLFISPVYRMGPTAPIYEEILKRQVPVVILGHHAPFCAQFPSVETEDIKASRAATEHLIRLGHRKIAFFAGPGVAPWARERFEGYRGAMREAQIEDDDHLIFASGGTMEAGAKTAAQMLEEATLPTAIVAINDLAAIGAATVLLQHHLSIPQQISVVGFGDILSSEVFRVPLTTVRQPKYRLGVAAVESMRRLLRKEAPGNRRLPAELVVRESTGPPPIGKNT